jgi:hypothetical protein
MLSDTDAADVTIGLAVCFKKRETIAPESKSGTDEDHNTHTKTS